LLADLKKKKERKKEREEENNCRHEHRHIFAIMPKKGRLVPYYLLGDH